MVSARRPREWSGGQGLHSGKDLSVTCYVNPRRRFDMYASQSRFGDLVKCLEIHGRWYSVQAGVFDSVWNRPFCGFPFQKQEFALGLEDSWEKPLDLDPCKPLQTAEAYEGPDIFCCLFLFINKPYLPGVGKLIQADRFPYLTALAFRGLCHCY